MWRKIGRVLGVILGWGAILAYILFASHLAQEHRAEQRVGNIIVTMADSTATEQFATSDRIIKQLKRGGFNIENEPVDSLDAVTISEYIARNGFVRDVDVYVTYSGDTHIDIKQHEPVVRLLCGGVNSYVTPDGVIFRSPQGAAYYAAVVTGAYKPMFASDYEGSANAHYATLVDRENEKLAHLGKEFQALKNRRGECLSQRSELRKQGKKGFFESNESYKLRKVGVDAEITKCTEQLSQLSKRKLQLEKRQRSVELHKKKLKKKYDDFTNLINFVTQVSDDSFWSSEIVQFVADTTSTGEISLRLVPRSGDFVIEYGTLANGKEKMRKLQTFYENGLSRIGWNRYKIVDIRYSKQVICTE